MVPKLGVALLVLAALATNGISGRTMERMQDDAPRYEELLYLPNGKHLKLASLGQASLLADMVYLWAIQYYSNYERGDRYRYVEHVFGNVIAELDPHYIDAYWMGALILTVEAKDLNAGLRLLDRGFAENPGAWLLPYLAGWECAHAKDYQRAEAYFAKAKAVPGAPAVVERLVAGMIGRAGDLRRAIATWRELLEDPESDAATVEIARRQLRELKLRADLAELHAAVERFRNENRRYPQRLDELVRGSYIAHLPQDPDGNAYRYDARTGRVSSSAGRVLGDS